MTKELSIENIKKELINKISNNSEILEYFENYLRDDDEKMTRYLKEYGMKYIKDNYIFPYDMATSGYCNFITVEVTEKELLICGNIEKCFNVSIMIALEKYKDLDKISTLLGKIATELYPDRSNYRNTPYNIDCSYNQFTNKKLVRVVQFTIK